MVVNCGLDGVRKAKLLLDAGSDRRICSQALRVVTDSCREGVELGELSSLKPGRGIYSIFSVGLIMKR